MSTNLNPPLAHVHDVNINKARSSPNVDRSSDVVPKRAHEGNIPTDLSMAAAAAAAAASDAAHIAHRNLEFHREPSFLLPIKNAAMNLPQMPQDPIPTSSIKFHPHYFVPSPKSLASASDMKFTNSISKKDPYLRDLRQTPSPIILKSSLAANSPGNSEHTVASMLRNYQVSPDAMLSATVNMSENEMLREGGFDIPVSSNHNNSSDDHLMNAGPSSLSSNCSSLRPPSNTTYELFDEESSREGYADAVQDLRLSPHALSNSSSSASESFGANMCRNTIPSNLEIITKSKSFTSKNSVNSLNHVQVEERPANKPTMPLNSSTNKIGKVKTKGYGGKSGTIPCLTCGKMFSSSSALTKHKLTHSDERKYVCQMCAKAFKRQDHLNGHMLTHRSKKPYECKVEGCGKSYCDARSLRRHNENHHSQQLNAGLLSSEMLLSRIRLAARTGPGGESAAAQLQMLAAQGEHGLTSSKLQNALLGWTGDSNQKGDADPHALTSLIEKLQQEPKIWAQLVASGFRIDPNLIPKPVACSICNKSFKNMPALNGHMRLHGGYFKKENDLSKEQLEKVTTETSSQSSAPPLQTASSSVRALIGEKINQRKNASAQNLNNVLSQSVPGSAAGSFTTPVYMNTSMPNTSQPFTSQSVAMPTQTQVNPVYTSSTHIVSNSTIISQSNSFSSHAQPQTLNAITNQSYVVPQSTQAPSYSGSLALSNSGSQMQSTDLYNVQNTSESRPDLQTNADLFGIQNDAASQNKDCGDDCDELDYNQIEPSVQLKSDADDVFFSETQLKLTIEAIKKEFTLPQMAGEKFRRHSDSDHFIVPKVQPTKKCNTITDQLRRKALTQRRTYRLSSDPGGDPFCDILENPLNDGADIPMETNNQQDTAFFQSNQDQHMQQFSNPTTPTQNIHFFPPNQMDMHQQPASSPHGYIPIQTEQISAPNTPTQPHGSFFQVVPQQHQDQMPAPDPTTPTHTHVGFFDNPQQQLQPHQEPMSNPCTPTQPNVGFFQSQQHHGHMSMPSTPTQQNTSFFPSHQAHPTTPTQPQTSFFQSQDHQMPTASPQQQPNDMYFQQDAQHQGQFSVPSTPTQSNVSFFQSGAQQMSAPNTPTAPHPQASVFPFTSNNQSSSSYNQLTMQAPMFDQGSFQFPKTGVMQQANQDMTPLDDGDLNASDDVFPDNFANIDDDAFMSEDTASNVNHLIGGSGAGDAGSGLQEQHLPTISIPDSVFEEIRSSSSQASLSTETHLSGASATLNICSKPAVATNSNILLTIPKFAQNNNDSGDDVFIPPSSLPTSPIRMKRKHRPEPLYIPPQVNTCGFQSRLRSPRLWDPSIADKKQLSPPPYTPPPMLSPVRSGPGLFWHVISSSGSVTPKSAPITPKFSVFAARKSSTESITFEEEPEPPPETDIQPHVNIGAQYQAQIPRCKTSRDDVAKVKDKADIIWDPSLVDHLSEDEIEGYLELSCTACMEGNGQNKEYALHVLQSTAGDIQASISKLMIPKLYLPKDYHLLTYQYAETEKWAPHEIDLYHQALSKSEKDFFSIAKEVKTKTVKQCIEFYYIWKKVCPDDYKRVRTIRRKREQDNIFYSLRSKGGEDADSATPKSDSRSATPDRDADPYSVGDKFACEYPDCSATFVSKQALNGHIRVHGGAVSRSPNHSPFTKDMDAAANNNNNNNMVNGTLNFPVHEVTTFDVEVPGDFPCKICGKVFHKVKSRNAHMKKHRQTDSEKKLKDIYVADV